jgi:lipopolysaccharide heptosyltransferase II
MSQLNKILIIRFSSIGDIILASPLIRILRRAYPDALIDFLTKAEYTDLVRSNPYLSAVFDLKSGDRAELRRIRQKIRSERYDAIFDIHNSLRSRYVRFGSGARKTFVVDKRIFHRFLLVNLRKNRYSAVVPVPLRYLEAGKTLGLQDDGAGLDVFVMEEIASNVTSRLGRLDLGRFDHVVGLVPSARHFTKQWPMERFVEFGVKCVKDRKAGLLVFGGKEDAEYCGDIVHMINAETTGRAAESLAGSLSLQETAVAMDRCEIVVTNDTGLMHLAAARKRKVVAIFGSTVKEFGFFPFGTDHAVVERDGLECRPCSHVGLPHCPEGHFKCMRDISAAQVLEAADPFFEK